MAQSTKDQVRLLISDVGGEDNKQYIFGDEEIETFIEITENIWAAAAAALRAIAVNEAFVQKRIEYLELKTDGPAVAKALMEAAKAFEEKGTEAEGDEGSLEIADMNTGYLSERDMRWAYATRLW